MKNNDSATDLPPVAIPEKSGSATSRHSHDARTVQAPQATSTSHRAGVLLAALGVLAFSFSFPATAWSLEGFGPWTAVGLRGSIAAILAAVALARWRAPRPRREDWPALSVVAIGCALGFPLLTTLALQTSTTSHSAVVIGALPMATACLSAWRTRSRLPTAFWVAASTGAAAVIGFALSQHRGALETADAYLFLALILCAAGYAEGGGLAGTMSGWRVIAWGVLLAAPVNIGVSVWGLTHESLHVTGLSLAGLAYVAAVSQFLGFVAWYRGMGIIGVPQASQLQLAQPVLTLIWSVWLMAEHVTLGVVGTGTVVLVCIAVSQRARTRS